jgi:hypothetical protein
MLFVETVEDLGEGDPSYSIRYDCDVVAEWHDKNGVTDHWCDPKDGHIILQLGEIIQIALQGADALRMLFDVEPFVKGNGNFFTGEHSSPDERWAIPSHHGDRNCMLTWDVGGIYLHHRSTSIDITNETAQRIYDALLPIVKDHPYGERATDTIYEKTGAHQFRTVKAERIQDETGKL